MEIVGLIAKLLQKFVKLQLTATYGMAQKIGFADFPIEKLSLKY